MSSEGTENLPREDVNIYMERLEMRSRSTVGKSMEYLWSMAGGALVDDSNIALEYDSWRADNPFEASIWDETRGSRFLPLTIEDWKTWWSCYKHNRKLLSRLSTTFKKLDTHIKSIEVKMAFQKWIDTADHEISSERLRSWNTLKGFSDGADPTLTTKDWLMQKALDSDVLSFNRWASERIPQWPEILSEVIRDTILEAWWGRNKSHFGKCMSSHLQDMEAYTEEINNAIRIHFLEQDGIKDWFLKEFSSKRFTSTYLDFQIFI